MKVFKHITKLIVGALTIALLASGCDRDTANLTGPQNDNDASLSSSNQLRFIPLGDRNIAFNKIINVSQVVSVQNGGLLNLRSGEDQSVLQQLQNPASSEALKQDLLLATPLTPSIQIAAIHKLPDFNSPDLAEVLIANSPLVPSVLNAMVNNAVPMNAADLKNVLIHNSPLRTSVLQSLIDNAGLFNSTDLRDLLIASSPLPGEILTQVGAVGLDTLGVATTVQPSAIADFSSQLSYYGRYAENVINNSGMSTDPATPTSLHNTVREDMWITTGATTGYIVFDLGDPQDLLKTHIWNYNETSEGKTARGVKDVEIWVSSDNDYNSASFTLLTTIQALEGGSTVQNFSSTAANVRFVKFNILSNHGFGSYVGLSEVRFSAGSGSDMDQVMAAQVGSRASDYTLNLGTAEVVASLNILPGALNEDKDISISVDDEQILGDVYLTFGPHGTVFNTPALLNIEAHGLDLSGFDPSTIQVYYDNTDTGNWELMQSSHIIVNQNEGYIKVVDAQLPHFSRYAIGAD